MSTNEDNYESTMDQNWHMLLHTCWANAVYTHQMAALF